MVVDRMLPKRDGQSIIDHLRNRGDDTPALILSALGQLYDRFKG
jgi:two-component system OmpR family response regulator